MRTKRMSAFDGKTDIEIVDVKEENIEDLCRVCVPPKYLKDPLFIKGIGEKRKWLYAMLKTYRGVAKLAYIDSEPVGMIQYEPHPSQKIVEIKCIFVPKKEWQKKEIGTKLLKALIEDMKSPKSYLDNKPPSALVTYAFETWGVYPQHLFYEKKGFKRVEEENLFSLYYPIKEDFIYQPIKKDYIPQEEDKGRAIIFYNPICPFYISFSEKMREAIKEVTPDVSIRIINEFEQPEEVEKRGVTYYCIVNTVPIKTFVLNKEKFQKEVKAALGLDKSERVK